MGLMPFDSPAAARGRAAWRGRGRGCAPGSAPRGRGNPGVATAFGHQHPALDRPLLPSSTVVTSSGSWVSLCPPALVDSLLAHFSTQHPPAWSFDAKVPELLAAGCNAGVTLAGGSRGRARTNLAGPAQGSQSTPRAVSPHSSPSLQTPAPCPQQALLGGTHGSSPGQQPGLPIAPTPTSFLTKLAFFFFLQLFFMR